MGSLQHICGKPLRELYMTEKFLDWLLFVTAALALVIITTPLWASTTIVPLEDGVTIITEQGEPDVVCVTLEDGIVVCQ